MGGDCSFQPEWLDPALFPELAKWVSQCKNSHYEALCRICRKVIDIKSMGHQALISHMKSAKHIKMMKHELSLSKQQSTLYAHASETERPNTSASTSSQSPSPSLESSSPSPRPPGVYDASNVVKAEILWALNTVCQHHSFRSCDGMPNIFKTMFPDSFIASQFQMARTKATYSITFGLAPYANNLLTDVMNVSDCPYVVCFDEALNKVAQRQQMDLLVRFWNVEQEQVCTRYLDSVFLGRSCASDMLPAFKAKLKQLKLCNLVQVSMDGPSVNWKFIRELQADIDVTLPGRKLLELGSCGLHVVHGAFRLAFQTTDFKLCEFLSAVYRVFKDSPARRANFTEITGSTVFPKKFCSVRWVENVGVATRTLEILPALRAYVKDVSPKPSIASFVTIENALGRPDLEAQLHFFKFFASKVEKFLRAYQTDLPLIPYLAGDLDDILRSVLKCVMKSSVIDAATSFFALAKVEMKEENCLPQRKTEVGVATTRAVQKLTDGQKLHFLNQCNAAFRAFVTKIFERSPLKYSIVRNASALCPAVIAASPGIAVSRFKRLAQDLFEKEIITESVADQSNEQFSNFCTRPGTVVAMKSFDRSEARLDALYCSLLKGVDGVAALFTVIRLVLTLSHGNAQVESGFSINKQLLVENMQERSLVAQRQVYDFVQSKGGVLGVSVDSTMLKAHSGAAGRYKREMELRRSEDKKRKTDIAILDKEIESLRGKRAKIFDESRSEAAEIEKKIADLITKKASL